MDGIRAVMLGHAVADALGVPVEFKSREELRCDPVSDMRGYGTYCVPAGSWSDDTSMALAALDSLKDGEIRYSEIMDNFAAWMERGEYTPDGNTFDMGGICRDAILAYRNGTSPTRCGPRGEFSNGNGALMRIHPFSLLMYFTGRANGTGIELIHSASSLTHGHERSLLASGIYSFVLWELLDSPCKASVIKGLAKAREYYSASAELSVYEDRLFRKIGGLGCGSYTVQTPCKSIGIDEIRSTGYVVDTLEAAIFCLLTTESYAQCVLKAVNLGSDTDTVAAVAGGLAGAMYGCGAIPKEWLTTLRARDRIESLCSIAADSWSKAAG